MKNIVLALEHLWRQTDKPLINGIILCIFVSFPLLSFSNRVVLERVGSWDHVAGFAMHPEENHLILALRGEVHNQLYESRLKDGTWSHPEAIDIINQHGVDGADIGGPFFYYDGKILFFHADYQADGSGYNLYFSRHDGERWSAPESMGPAINSPANELYPAMPPGKQKFFFSREVPEADVDKPRRSPACQRLYVSFKDVQGYWQSPEPLHDAINMACEYGMHVAPDGNTIYFSSIDQNNHRDGFNIYHARQMSRDAWVLPVLIEEIVSDYTNINPVFAGNALYFIQQEEGRRNIEGRIYKYPLPDVFKPESTISPSGTVRHSLTKEAIHADIYVFDPTTLRLLGQYASDKASGHYFFPLLADRRYIVDIESPGYSFSSFQPDLTPETRDTGPGMIELFDEAELILNVYDGEIFRPLDGEVWATSQCEEQLTLEAKSLGNGLHALSLPIGKSYQIHAATMGFEENDFLLSLEGKVIFGRFLRDLPMDPKQLPVDILVKDAETGAPLNADITIENQEREERFFIQADQMQSGQITRDLRVEDQYAFTARGVPGYSFYHSRMYVNQEDPRVEILLEPLVVEAAIVLNNIHFATNSAELTTASFEELDRVVVLMQDNPDIRIEISAHTDDVGTDAYNLLLSGRRAQSVVNYLLDNDVEEQRLIAKGYGLRQPLVPNTSDENRAKNRRVEFMILNNAGN